jgi:Ran GTPase-activating protein (RanGAP) involved in mRNA processing and transport
MLDDTESTKQFFDHFNEKHGTDFDIIKFEYDEVTFALIETIESNNDDILQLGIEFSQHSHLNRILN